MDLSLTGPYTGVCAGIFRLSILVDNEFLTYHLATVGPISILNSDSNPTEKIDPLTHLHMRARKYAQTRIADFGLFWPKCASVFLAGIFFS